MEKTVHSPRLVRFGSFEVDLAACEVRKGGLRLKLTGQPFQVLAILLERPGEVVTREELQKRLWPDTFVDVDHNLNTAINKIREVLGDSAESPRFVETAPRRGYRFIGPVEDPLDKTVRNPHQSGWVILSGQTAGVRIAVLLGVIPVLLAAGLFFLTQTRNSNRVLPRILTRLTFDEGLQSGASWSPDGQFIAYSSNHGGKFDIWVKQVSGGDAVQVTRDPGQNWQPDWSPDGKYIAYRSEYAGGGLYVVPALGGASRKVANFGVYPRWSPDGSRILFRPTSVGGVAQLYTVDLAALQPHEVLESFLATHHMLTNSAAWYPRGDRITVYSWDWQTSSPVFWTVPLNGGEPLKSELSPELLKQFGDIALARHLDDAKFSWSSSGNAIYFEPTVGGATNIWKVVVDPKTLQAKQIERMTTGPGPDSGVGLSSDGNKLAFSGQSRLIQTWMASFDSRSDRLSADGKPVTPPGVEAWHGDLSRDGKKLAFSASHGNVKAIWQKSLPSGKEIQILGDDSYARAYPFWSPDGTQLAYTRTRDAPVENNIVVWSSQTHEERVIADGEKYSLYSWSPTGEDLVVTKWNSENQRAEIWLLSITSGKEKRQIAASPDYYLFQGQLSPDGRWTAFEAIKERPYGRESTIYVVSSAGGSWRQITDGQQWDDKPRWSPDGKTIYFVSGRGGFYNVWGKHFDPNKGEAVGLSFQLTGFDSPALMVPAYISDVNLSVAADKLCLTTSQSSGGLWVLNHLGD